MTDLEITLVPGYNHVYYSYGFGDGPTFVFHTKTSRGTFWYFADWPKNPEIDPDNAPQWEAWIRTVFLAKEVKEELDAMEQSVTKRTEESKA